MPRIRSVPPPLIGWQDLRVPLTRAATGSGLPALATFRDGLMAYQFSNTTDQQLYIDVQLPHSVLGTVSTPGGAGEIRPHIHWSPGNSTDTGSVRWVLEYSAANAVNPPGNAFGASTSSAVLQAAAGVAYSHQIAEWDPIPITALRDSAVILCRVYRDADHVGDTFAGSGGAFGLSVDFHYETRSYGSLTEYAGAL